MWTVNLFPVYEDTFPVYDNVFIIKEYCSRVPELFYFSTQFKFSIEFFLYLKSSESWAL